jgi:hypothetical protein
VFIRYIVENVTKVLPRCQPEKEKQAIAPVMTQKKYAAYIKPDDNDQNG